MTSAAGSSLTFGEDDLIDVLGIPFSTEQLAVITAPPAAQIVVAGAGSGKTTVMAARVVWLVARGQVRAEQVLGLTFTRKAAAELGSRARSALARLPDAMRPAPGLLPTVMTYDAYAGQLVVEHGLRLGIEPRDEVVADARRYLLAERVLARHDRVDTAIWTSFEDAVVDLVGLDTAMSDQLQTPESVRFAEIERARHLTEVLCALDSSARKPLREWISDTRRTSLARAELAELVGRMRTLRRERGITDFGDRTVAAVQLAEQRPEVAAGERERFQVVLLDEYQDTSVAQARLLAALFRDHPVTAVGDPCQAIYGWRGASASNLATFPESFATDWAAVPRRELRTSRRSGEHILSVANALSQPLRDLGADVVALQTSPTKLAQGDVLVARHDSWRNECTWLAEQIAAAVREGTPAGECAILLRRRADMPDVVEALETVGLPVQVAGLTGLLVQPEVADVVAVLQALGDPAANVAWLRILRGPRWRIGDRDLAALGRRARTLTGRSTRGGRETGVDSLISAVSTVDHCDLPALGEAVASPGDALSAQAASRVHALAAEMAALRAHAGPVAELVRRVVEVTGIDIEVAATSRSIQARRREQLAAFLDVAAGWSDTEGPGSLSSFLAFLRAGQDHERGLELAQPSGLGTGSDAVQVLTVHASKGLEWSLVAVPGLVATVFPETSRRSLWTKNPDQLPPDLRGDGRDIPGLGGCTSQDWKDFEDSTNDQLRREERRLAYVALTRAADRLLLSSHVWGPTQSKSRGVSPFLDEVCARIAEDPSLGRVATWVPDDVTDPRGERHGAAQEADRDRLLRAATEVRERLASTVSDPILATDVEPDLVALIEEARRARSSTHLVPLPRTLTASQVVALRQDPDALAAALARPMPRRPSAAATRGTAFHAWVERRFGQRPLIEPSELPGWDDGDEAIQDLGALQQAFLASRWADLVPHAVEAPFATVVAGHLLRGRIDAVYRHDGADGVPRWEVVDWKTGRETADPVQLAIYRLAWARQVAVAETDVLATFAYVVQGTQTRPELLDEAGLTELLRGPR